MTFNADGSFSYTPNAEFIGSDSFTYKASDGTHTSDAATVNIFVNPIADVPVAVGDAYSTNKDQTLTVDAASGVLHNDADPDGGSLTAVIHSQPTQRVGDAQSRRFVHLHAQRGLQRRRFLYLSTPPTARSTRLSPR